MKLFGKGRSPGRRLDPPSPTEPVFELEPARDDPAEAISYAFTPDLVVMSEEGGRAANALRGTALEILNQHVIRGRRSLAVCGVSRGVGVSFLTINLAVALAMDGVSTLVIDADLAHPSLENFVRPSRATPGLRQYLQSPDMDREDIVHRDVTPGLSLVYAGGPTQHPSELVGHARFGDLVRACMRDHDLVMLDTPPASLTADTRHIAGVAHYVLIAARAGSSHASAVSCSPGPCWTIRSRSSARS
jgi:Mrp family chromosome partitioning ATPase